MDNGSGSDALAVREPRQHRTREQWDRVLDAGVSLLAEGGYEAFTISAVCDRAEVPPRALYARTDSKDGLFLAVYERGMERVLASHRVFLEPDGWDLDNRERVEKAIRALVQIFVENLAFLHAIVLISGAHAEVARRGEAYRTLIGDLFTSVLAPLDESSTHDDPSHAREFCFTMTFSALVVRIAYGPGFGFAGSQDDLIRDLATVAQRYLLGI